LDTRAMDHTNTGQDEPEQSGIRDAEQQPSDREALRRRVRESLLRCPEAEPSR